MKAMRAARLNARVSNQRAPFGGILRAAPALTGDPRLGQIGGLQRFESLNDPMPADCGFAHHAATSRMGRIAH